MVCPNCGAQNEAGAKFCADCGNKLADAAPIAASPIHPVAPIPPAAPAPAAQPLPAAPPPWAQPAAPAQPLAPAQPAAPTPPPWTQPPTQAAPAAPQWPAPQPQQPPAYPQQQSYPGYAPQPPAYPAQGYGLAPSVTATATTAAPIAALLAIAGGAIAIASGWMPWETAFGQSITPMDSVITDRTSDLANGYYLLAGGAIALLCGLALFLKLVRTPSATTLIGLAAIVGGCLVVAVEAAAYSEMSDSLKVASLGYGLYAGVVGGAIAIAGGAMALRKSR